MLLGELAHQPPEGLLLRRGEYAEPRPISLGLSPQPGEQPVGTALGEPDQDLASIGLAAVPSHQSVPFQGAEEARDRGPGLPHQPADDIGNADSGPGRS